MAFKSIVETVVEETMWESNMPKPEHAVCCPVCGHDFAHTTNVREVDGGDRYKAWNGRGKRLSIHVEGECGHEWDICFGLHKGRTSVYCEISENPEVSKV